MDESVRSMLQQLLDLSQDQFRRINYLQAACAVHEQILFDVMRKYDVMRDLPPEIYEAYLSVRHSSQELADNSNSPEAFNLLMDYIDLRLNNGKPLSDA